MKKIFLLSFVVFSVINLHANDNKDTLIFKNRIRTLKEKYPIGYKYSLPIFEDTIFIKADKLCFKEYYYTPDSGLQKIDRQVDIQQIKKIKKFIENKQYNNNIFPGWVHSLFLVSVGYHIFSGNKSLWSDVLLAIALVIDYGVSDIIERKQNSVTEIELYSGQIMKIYTGTQSRKTIKQLKLLLNKK